ncbi:transporter substrate-binding domain-containing protein [Marinobacter adhaerens]|jgi:polar amino acid transport system substrate-binding protein|uniref:transporter substrate-binding domain-containing diguanylate cyclase n=1 Tax=Marinobacter adhaerens TaxID=1033846 RepID=UPI001E291A5E|nr:transporter substrate-binding domain-containing protein [Marinobacter adhaerens]MCD1646127.1 transporter substrate-binding domain-containing protein [Marinobacter adhaerens]
MNSLATPCQCPFKRVAVAVLFALVYLLAAPPAWAQEVSETVTVGIVADNKPYSFNEGRGASGFSVDILREVAEQADLKFTFRAGSWPEVYGAFMRGELDVIDGISFRQDRAEQILFTEPYHIRQTYLMHDTQNPVGNVDSIEDLQGLRVGVVRDIYYRDALTEKGITLNTYDSLHSLIRALAFGWVDVIIGPQLTLQYYANEAGFRFLAIAGKAPLGDLAREDFRIGVLKTNEALFNRISQGLAEIPDQRKRELLERWQEFGGASLSGSGNFVLSPEQRRFIAETGPVRVGLMRDYAPYSFESGTRIQGLTVDILNRLSDLTGLQVIPVGGQWIELLPLFRNGEIDILANMSFSPERSAFTRFTEPYHTIPNVAFTREQDLSLNTLEDLKGMRVALGSGIYYEQPLQEALGDDARIFTAQDAMFEALARGQVDVVLAALPNGNFWVRELGLPGVRIAGELILDGLPGEDLRFGVRPGLAPLAGILDQALATISAEEIRTIEDRWLGASGGTRQPGTGKANLTEAELAWLENRSNRVSMCIDPDWLPLEGRDANGKHAGLSAEVFRLFAERTPIHFDVVPTDNWQQSMQAARERRCDLLAMAMKTPERSEFMNFTESYLEVPNVVLGRIEAPFIERIGDLRGQKVGVVEGYAFAELLQTRYPSMDLIGVSNEQEGLRRLQNHELDGYITTLATASYYMQELGLADLKVIGRIPADWSLAVAIRDDEPVLLGIMQKLVSSLTTEERRSLESHWRNIQLKQTVDYTLIWQLLIAGALVTALLIYWNRKLGRLNKELAVANETLARLSVTDDLTQLGNRSYFDQEFRKSFQWCQRHHSGFAVAMVDADHFKKINDTFGHEAGDLCLKALADTMRKHFRRETDRLSRFGGEEFVVFASYEDSDEIRNRLETFREAVASACNICGHNDIRLTISIGLATGIPGPEASPAEFLRQADQALYQAKQNGRNRLEVRAV